MAAELEFKDEYNESVTTTKSGVDIARSVHLTEALKRARNEMHSQIHHHAYEHSEYERDRRRKRHGQWNRQQDPVATGHGYGEFQKMWVRKTGSWRDPSYRTEGACKNAAQHEGLSTGRPAVGLQEIGYLGRSTRTTSAFPRCVALLPEPSYAFHTDSCVEALSFVR